MLYKILHVSSIIFIALCLFAILMVTPVHATNVCQPRQRPTVTPTMVPSPIPVSTTKPTPEPVVEPSKLTTVDARPGCPDTVPTKVPANFHIYRKARQVIAKWIPDHNQQGSEVVIYYGHNGYGMQYSAFVPNNGYATINLYSSSDFTFWAAYKNGCTQGSLTKPVIDSVTKGWVLFRQ